MTGQENVFRRHVRLVHELLQVRAVVSNWLQVGIAAYLYKMLPLPERDLTVRARDGSTIRVRLTRNVGALYPVLEVFAQGAYECEWEIEEDPVVLDVGGHVGAFLVWLAAQRRGLTGVVYEPDPDAFTYLTKNLDANGLAHVEARLEALGDLSLEGQLHRPLPGGGTSSLYESNGERRGHSIPASVVSFDEAVARFQHEISVLKLDCEGAEYDIVLRSDPSSFRRIRRIVIAHHPIHGGDPNAIVARLEELGFTCVKRSTRSEEEGMLWFAR
jgi:FkbM family methyltransferase